MIYTQRQRVLYSTVKTTYGGLEERVWENIYGRLVDSPANTLWTRSAILNGLSFDRYQTILSKVLWTDWIRRQCPITDRSSSAVQPYRFKRPDGRIAGKRREENGMPPRALLSGQLQLFERTTFRFVCRP